MKYIGIDFGSKRVGLAVSEEDGKLAFPHSVLPNTPKLLSQIGEIIKKEAIQAIVVGESKKFDGTDNKITGKIEKFKEELASEIDLPIFWEPEFLTSAQAEHLQGKNEMHDASAAAIILQSFLDKLK